MHGIRHPIFSLSMANSVALISAIAVNLIVARGFSSNELSAYVSQVNIINVALPFFEFGLYYVLSSRGSEAIISKGKSIDGIVGAQFIFGVAASGCVFLLLYMFEVKYIYKLTNLNVAFICLGCAAMATFSTFKAIAASRLDYIAVAKATMTNSLVRIIFIVLIVVMLDERALLSIFAIYFLSPVISVFCGNGFDIKYSYRDIIESGQKLLKLAWYGRWIILAASLYPSILTVHINSASKYSEISNQFSLIIILASVMAPIAEAFRTVLIRTSNVTESMSFQEHCASLLKFIPFWIGLACFLEISLFGVDFFGLFDKVGSVRNELMISIVFVCMIQILAMCSIYIHRVRATIILVLGGAVSIFYSIFVFSYFGNYFSLIERVCFYYSSLAIVEIISIGYLYVSENLNRKSGKL